MKDKILTLIIGILIGAVITAGGFLIYSNVTGNNGNGTNDARGEMQMDGNMAGGKMQMDGNMTPGDIPDENGTEPSETTEETETTES